MLRFSAPRFKALLDTYKKKPESLLFAGDKGLITFTHYSKKFIKLDEQHKRVYEESKKNYHIGFIRKKAHEDDGGSYGDIYKGHLLDAEGNPIEASPVCVKEVKKIGHDITKEESARLQDVYGQPRVVDHKNHLEFQGAGQIKEFIFMPFHKGIQLFDLPDTIPFDVRLKIILGLALEIDRLHGATKDRDELNHSDIKEENIIVNIIEKSVEKEGKKEKIYEVEVHLVDFGFASKEILKFKGYAGTPSFAAPEFVFNGRKTKSNDIYALGAIFSQLLGAYATRIKDEIASAKNLTGIEKMTKAANTPYDLRGLLRSDEYRNIPMAVKFRIATFLLRMCSQNSDDRPNSKEILRFFQILNRVAQRHNHFNNGEKLDEQDAADVCQLFLLSKGFWRLEVPSVVAESKEEVLADSLDSYDFEHNPAVVNNIYRLPETDLTNPEVIEKIFNAKTKKEDSRKYSPTFKFAKQGLPVVSRQKEEHKAAPSAIAVVKAAP